MLLRTPNPLAPLSFIHLSMSNQLTLHLALPVTLSSPIKRPLPSTFDDVDSENVDPSLFSSNKKSKTFDGTPIKPSKSSRYVLTDAFSPVTSVSRPVITPKRLEVARSTPVQKRKLTQSSSAPAVAGRSPKSKRIGILSRRRVSSSPYTRVDPPPFDPSNGLPFSIDAALSGTVASYKSEQPQEMEITTLDDYVPKSWMFNIYEETEDERLGNLMQHSTCTLDISDDEESHSAKYDRGKENIPPLDHPTSYMGPITTVRPVSRRDMMTDEPRTPLGDLDAKDYYAEGCDASSYIIIPAEKSYENGCAVSEVSNLTTTSEAKQTSDPDQVSFDVMAQVQDGWKDLLVQVEESEKSRIAAACIASVDDDSPAAEIEIWESESAKGEDDQASHEESLEKNSTLQSEPDVTSGSEAACSNARAISI